MKHHAKEAGARHDPLLAPLKIRGMHIRNRIVSTAHSIGMEIGGMPTEAFELYHIEKAKGGVGLTIFGGSSNIAPDSPNIFAGLDVGTDRIVPHFQRFSQRLKSHGAAVMCQITHLGRRGVAIADRWLPTIAPSIVREPQHRSFPKEMDLDDIRRVVKAYGEAAARCEKGGLDGIEIVGASHLIGQFFSPRTNARTDEFGGSVANRCRFALMVLGEIRAKVSADFVVGFRHVVDEGGGPGSLGTGESLEIANRLEESGGIDFFNALYGKLDNELSLSVDWMPGMASPSAPWLKYAAMLKKAVSVPVLHAAKINDIATARYAVSEGLIDLVGMTRAHIADPHLVSKLVAGREDAIRPCVSATHCQGPHRPHCIHNPATGRETTIPQRIGKSASGQQKVVIVGAGPGGLEAARICAERGHQVVLFEAASQVGGQVLLAAQGSWRKDLIGIVDWRVGEIERLGVDVRTGTFAETTDVLAEKPNTIIVASGGLPYLEWLQGHELVSSVWDVLSGVPTRALKVLVFDGTGRHPALLAAERLAERGADVHFVTSDGFIAQEMSTADRISWKQRFYKKGIRIVPDTNLETVYRLGNGLSATFRNVVSLENTSEAFEEVYVEFGTLPLSDLYDALREDAANGGVLDIDAFIAGRPQPKFAEGFSLFRIGDAVSSRSIHAAMLDAARICSRL